MVILKMPKFKCEMCGAELSAENNELLVQVVSDHARKYHSVEKLPEELVEKIRKA
jgi:predicted small metal-binding protein